MQSAAFDPVKSAECIRIGWDVLHDYPSHKERFTWSKPGGGGGEGVILGILCGVCRPILQTLTLFQTKIVIFPFSDFRPEIMSSLLRLERKQKDFLKPIFEFALSLFLSYLFGVEKPNMFIHSRSSLENYTRFQTKMGTASTRFRTETAQGPNLLGLHMLIWLK